MSSATSRLRFLIAFMTLTTAVVSSCTAPVTKCEQLESGTADAVLLVLTDGSTPSFQREIDRLADQPAAVLRSPGLGLNSDSAIVVLATYDQAGQVTRQGAFNLAGVGPNGPRRTANARRQAECLRERARSLPAATGGNLLAALEPATSIAASSSTSGRASVAAFGLGRSVGDGFSLSTVDLSTPDLRSSLLDQLQRSGVIRPLTDHANSLVLAAPAENLTNSITAGGIRYFASDLCERLAPVPCQSSEVLG
jgi:hypothetical protein